MSSKQSLLVILETTFLGLFTVSPSLAFSITYDSSQPPSVFTTFDYYETQTHVGYTWLPGISEFPRGGTPGLKNLLTQQFPDWSFETASKDLAGSFKIDQHYACGFGTLCALGLDTPKSYGVGAVLNLDYIPGIGDPDPKTGKVRWIQRVKSNHSDRLGIHGQKENILDISDNQTENPYYDRYPRRQPAHPFFDRPYREDPNASHFWIAELFLIEEIAPKKIIIYNGIRWGWNNQTQRQRRDRCKYKPFPNAPICYGGYPDYDEIGLTQDESILPDTIEDDWEVFEGEPSDRWFDPPTSYGFEFQAIGDTLFTGISDFPIMEDDSFTVAVGDTILGQFSPGDSVDFVSLFGQGVSSFKITDIDTPFDETQASDFPIKLTFNNPTGSFKMRPFAQSIPESSMVLGLLSFGVLGLSLIRENR